MSGRRIFFPTAQSTSKRALLQFIFYAVIYLVLAIPIAVWSKPNQKSTTAPHKAAKSTQASTKKIVKSNNTKRSNPRPRCRDIFCTTQVVRMDDSEAEQKGLTENQVESTIKRNRRKMEPCLVQVRRRDPTKKVARLEFVVTGGGKVLATRVDGKRYSPLSRCLFQQMHRISFPSFKQPRAVASVTLAIPQ